MMSETTVVARGPLRAGSPSLRLRAGFVLIGGVTLAALLSFLWTPYETGIIDISGKLLAPSLSHPLGTDHFGRDVLSMIMVGARNSLAVALVAVVIGAGFGVPLGLIAAARKGFVGEAIMRTNDVIFAFPSLLMAVMITAAYGVGAINAIIAIGIFNMRGCNMQPIVQPLLLSINLFILFGVVEGLGWRRYLEIYMGWAAGQQTKS